MTRSQHDGRRANVVKMVYLVFFTFLAEGALRKWVFPELSAYLYFLPDPVVLTLYLYSLASGFIGRSGLERFWLWFAALSTALGSIGYMVDGITPFAWMLGTRNYWLYMPLAFIVANTFRLKDVERLFGIVLFISLPYAGLIYLQYSSPPSDWINRSVGESGYVATVAHDIVRPYGLFTWTTQNVSFTAFIASCYLAMLLLKRRLTRDFAICVLAMPAVAAMSVLTGSRSILFLLAASILAVAVGVVIYGRRKSYRAVGSIVAVSGIAMTLLTTQFGDMQTAMGHRLEIAERTEGAISGRAITTLLSFEEALWTAPFLGHGIGRGSPATTRLTEEEHLLYGEEDLKRNVNELGLLLGLVFLGMRVHLAIELLRRALWAARRGQFAGLPLSGVGALMILALQITNSASASFVVWLSVGLVLAYSRQVMGCQGVIRTQLRPPMGRSDLSPRSLR